MFPTTHHPCRTIATRSVLAAIPVAMVCAYATHVVLPAPRVATDAFIETASIVDSPSTIGIADSDLYGMSQADIDTTLDNLESIGVQDIRVLVPWALVEPAAGTYNWTFMDEVINAAAARNMGVVADVTSTPTWDAPAGTILGAGTPNPTDYASFLTQVATRYGTNISSYEIWNEPNYALSYDPIDPATYTALLKAGYTAIKAVDPQASVIAAGLGAGSTLGNLTLNPVTFVQDMLADGASGYFDALSFHPYEESLEFSQGAGVAGSPLDQLNSIEQLLAANGDASAKIWITEYGLSTADVSQQTQATYIQNLIDTWQTLSYAGPVFIYTAQDGTSTDPTGTYGIYNANWTPKLAVAVIQAEIAKYAKAVTPPVTTVAQQLAAYEQAVAQALQTFAQQYAQALANAFAALGTRDGDGDGDGNGDGDTRRAGQDTRRGGHTDDHPDRGEDHDDPYRADRIGGYRGAARQDSYGDAGGARGDLDHARDRNRGVGHLRFGDAIRRHPGHAECGATAERHDRAAIHAPGAEEHSPGAYFVPSSPIGLAEPNRAHSQPRLHPRALPRTAFHATLRRCICRPSADEAIHRIRSARQRNTDPRPTALELRRGPPGRLSGDG